MSRIFLSPPHMGGGERELLLDAFDSNWIAPLGPHVNAFEQEFAAAVEMPYAVALSSGTAALHLALHVLGVGRSDEVITASMTFAATANAITYVGARPAFIDSRPDTWTIDPDLLEDELSQRARRGPQARAVIPVDVYGQCCDYSRIAAICDRFGVTVIEDAAEALGSTYRGRLAGTFGAAAAFSFNGNKIITTSGGGMLVSTNSKLVETARYLSTQARGAAVHYEHTEVGYNYRLSNLLAAVGRGQLRGLPAKVARRREIYAEYARAFAALPGIRMMPLASYGQSNCWLSCVTIEPDQFGATREEVRLELEAADIESRPLWKPMHLQPVFSSCSMRGGSVVETLFDRGLCLPSGSSLTQAQQARICEIVAAVGTAARVTRRLQ